MDAETNGNVVLVLDRALSSDGVNWFELELEFPVRDGEWVERGWGYAVHFQRGHHVPRIVRQSKVGDTRRLTVEVQVGPDAWVPGGRAAYDIELRPAADGFDGTFEGHFRRGSRKLGGPDRALPPCLVRGAAAPSLSEPDWVGSVGEPLRTRGRVTGRRAPAWPGAVSGFVSPAPCEHPRLPFRKRDLPLLRKRAQETAEGRAILDRARAVVDVRPGDGTDKFSAWPAVGYGFLYAMTGEQTFADRAQDVVLKTFFANVGGRQGEQCVQDIHHAPRLQALALAFDLCYDSWEETFRTTCVDEIQRRTWELRLGQFEGAIMDGYNPNPWSNHNAIRASCAGLGALAVLGERNTLGREMTEAGEIADLSAWEARQHYLTGLGGSGWCMEGDYYKNMTQERGFAYFPAAYANARGLRLDGGPVADFDMVGYFLEAPPSDGVPRLPEVAWSAGLATVPPDMMPGVRWLFDRAVGLQGDKSFGIAYGMMAPFAMALYPFDVSEQVPAACFRWMAPDPRKGHWVFRPVFRDGDDILLSLNMKSETLFGSWAPARSGTPCNLLLKGFGRTWTDGTHLVRPHRVAGFNSHHGGRLVAWRQTSDRTAVMDWNMDLAYLQEVPGGRRGELPPEEFARKQGALAVREIPNGGGPFVDFGIRATRSMAVDCSGASGSPLLVAMVEQVSLPTNLVAGASGARATSGDMGEAAQQEALRALLRKSGVAVEGREVTASEPPRDAFTRWELGLRTGPLAVRGNRFTVGPESGPTLAGVLAGPARLAADALVSDARGTYFVVLALQKGAPPAFDVQGEGLGAVVKVGRRTVRFAGQTLVLE